jgi:hypothetical protein
MTEQEYSDLSDLQLYRRIKEMLRNSNSFDNPNKTRLLSIQENLQLMIEDLQPKIKIE